MLQIKAGASLQQTDVRRQSPITWAEDEHRAADTLVSVKAQSPFHQYVPKPNRMQR